MYSEVGDTDQVSFSSENYCVIDYIIINLGLPATQSPCVNILTGNGVYKRPLISRRRYRFSSSTSHPNVSGAYLKAYSVVAEDKVVGA